jgi:hypothetical protein
MKPESTTLNIRGARNFARVQAPSYFERLNTAGMCRKVNTMKTGAQRWDRGLCTSLISETTSILQQSPISCQKFSLQIR